MSRTSCGSEIDGSFSIASAKQALVTAAAWPSRVFRVLRERRQLAMLDQSMLKDIGLSKADAYREWSRAFWDLPSEFGSLERPVPRERSCRD
jgi:uncharacterized protein YjiS (DUF1127 family)